jgi:hypothetical protein
MVVGWHIYPFHRPMDVSLIDTPTVASMPRKPQRPAGKEKKAHAAPVLVQRDQGHLYTPVETNKEDVSLEEGQKSNPEKRVCQNKKRAGEKAKPQPQRSRPTRDLSYDGPIDPQFTLEQARLYYGDIGNDMISITYPDPGEHNKRP